MNNVVNALYKQAIEIENSYWQGHADINDIILAWNALHACAVQYGYNEVASNAKERASIWTMGVK